MDHCKTNDPVTQIQTWQMCQLWTEAQCSLSLGLSFTTSQSFSARWIPPSLLLHSSYSAHPKGAASLQVHLQASRHYRRHCSLWKLWPFFLEGAKWSPRILRCCFASRDGNHTENPPHPPSALLPGQHLTSCTIPSFSLRVRISITDFLFFWTFFYVHFCSSVTPFVAAVSVSSPSPRTPLCHPRCSSIVALAITSHTFYVGSFFAADSVSLCVYRVDSCSSPFKPIKHECNSRMMVMFTSFCIPFPPDLTNDYLSPWLLCSKAPRYPIWLSPKLPVCGTKRQR